ncbi:MAG: hypothetical protein SGBAC_001171 [Bacillariaceae sp.]
MSIRNNTNEEQRSVASEVGESSQNAETSENSSDQYSDNESDNESDDWILDELQRQIDDQLQADIDRQLEEHLWKEMDEQMERQMDKQIQKELNQQFDDLLATQSASLIDDTDDIFNASKIHEKGDLLPVLQSLSLKTPLESSESQNADSKASAFTINAQIQKVVDQYEGLALEVTK